ncbi:hypothetical protein RXV86_18605 [Alisedimentitalea sp. MJ-SS2]|uniref:hypothetical protein n=1 Tax=Aliisedimentitalea sp. MJ-SS2 TaxID=3049795 RepID=UPI002908E24D|nr:hypothetical protein [Alisedimentitalea sp. MJ-SS2]MDU8929409.1 hypothetical protein [Alisedimentitalea sp. MJ-SS2]
MSQSILDTLVENARKAATSDQPTPAIRQVLRDSLADRDTVADAIAATEEDEVLLFEDDTCSIWSCRYDANVVFAPHEHCVPVHIAVYRGAEVQVLYHRDSNRLRHAANKTVPAGEIISLGADAVHAITAEGPGHSHAIHIYQGPLTRIERSLFDWTSGREIAFTIENFHALQRRKSEMEEFR